MLLNKLCHKLSLKKFERLYQKYLFPDLFKQTKVIKKRKPKVAVLINPGKTFRFSSQQSEMWIKKTESLLHDQIESLLPMF